MTRSLCVNVVLEIRIDDESLIVQRVLWIDPEPGDVALIDVMAPNAWPIWVPRRSVLDEIEDDRRRFVDFEMRSATGAAFPSEKEFALEGDSNHRLVRDRRLEIISPLVDDPTGAILRDPRPSRRLRDVAREAGVSAANLRRWLRRYWQRGQTPMALLPDYDRCGAPGRLRTAAVTSASPKRGRPTKGAKAGRTEPAAIGKNVDDAVRAKLTKGARFITVKGLTPTEAYKRTLETEFYTVRRMDGGMTYMAPSSDAVYPTFGQFMHHTRALRNPLDVAKASEGRRYPLTRRPRTGSSTHMAYGPGSIYQIDATVADVFLISQRDRTLIIGRPINYLMIDAWSHMITALHVTLRMPSWMEMGVALYQGFSNKVAFCESLQRPIRPEEWPCEGVPDRIMGDRGEPIRKYGNHAVKALGFAIDTTASYRADWKGIVEGKIGFLSLEAMQWMPGYVDSDARTRGAHDYRRDARHTLPEFARHMLEFALWHNNHRPLIDHPLPQGYSSPNGEAPTPRDLWNWGIEHRSGKLRSYPDEFMRVQLLPSKLVVPSRRGYRYTKGVYYSSASGESTGAFVGRTPRQAAPQVQLAVDTRCMGTAYVLAPNGIYEPARLVGDSTRFANWSLSEVEDEFARQEIAEKIAKSERLQSIAERDARVAAIEALAVSQTDAALEDAGRTFPQHKDMKVQRAADLRAFPGIAGPVDAPAAPTLGVSADTHAAGMIPATAPSAAGAPTPAPAHHAPTARVSMLDVLQRALLPPDAEDAALSDDSHPSPEDCE